MAWCSVVRLWAWSLVAVSCRGLWARRLTVLSQDRRARGESGDPRPHAVERERERKREREDLAAMLPAIRQPVGLPGHSAGGILALLGRRCGHHLFQSRIRFRRTPVVWHPPLVEERVEAVGTRGGAGKSAVAPGWARRPFLQPCLRPGLSCFAGQRLLATVTWPDGFAHPGAALVGEG
jgi:hypothetical protein